MNLDDFKGHTIVSIRNGSECGFDITTDKGVFNVSWSVYPDGTASDYNVSEDKYPY